MGKQLNGDGFEEISTPRRRERRGLPHSGGGILRNAKFLPKKLAGEFVVTLVVANFGDRFRELGVAAHVGVFRSGTSASRRTPAYIYRYRVWRSFVIS
jgi:hypothetical protein